MQHENIHVRITSDFPESVCLSSLRDPIYYLKGEPQKLEIITSKINFSAHFWPKWEWYKFMTLHNFFSWFVKVRGNAHHFGLKGFIGKCGNKFSCFRHISYLFWFSWSAPKIKSGVLKTRLNLKCSTLVFNKYTPYKNSTQQGWNQKLLSGIWLLLPAFCNIHVYWILNWSTPDTISFSNSLNCLIISVLECFIIIWANVYRDIFKQILLISETNF